MNAPRFAPEADADARPLTEGDAASFRIAYVDASLRDQTGHYANACRHIAKELRERGFRVDVFANAEVQEGLATELGATPCFHLRPYKQSRAFGRIDSFIHALSFSHDLRAAWATGAYPFLYFNSVLAPQLAAIGRWLASFPGGKAPLVAVEFGAPSGASTQGSFAPFAAQYRRAGRRLRALDASRILLFTFDPAASSEYADLLGLPVAVLPPVHAVPRPLRPRARDSDGRITIGFLGHQRTEKGVDLIPDIVRGLREAGCKDRILIHDGDAAERPIVRTLREIADTDPLVRFLHQPADAATWQDLLQRTDLAVLPYEPNRYRASYSALAIEAVSAGIPMIVPAGTTMESLATEYQGRPSAFGEWKARAVCQAILGAVSGFEHLSASAFSGAGAWEQRNGARRFADRLLEFAANPAARSPSRSARPVSSFDKGVVQALRMARGGAERAVLFLRRLFRGSS